MQAWTLGIFNIDNREAVRAVGDVGIGASQIKSARVLERYHTVTNHPRFVRLRDINNLQSVIIGYKCVPKLHGHSAWMFEFTTGQFCHQRWRFEVRVTDTENEQSSFSDHE